MSYKYVTGSVRRGDIYYEDDRQGAQTYIDFGYDSIALRPSGSAILYAEADAIGIGTTDPKNVLDVHVESSYFQGLADDEGGGLVVKAGSGTLTTGRLYYLHTDGTWTEANANSTANGADQLLGIALGSSPTTHGVLLRGFFDAATSVLNFSAGKVLYVDTAGGKMNTTAPSAASAFVRMIGYCGITQNVIYFNPSKSWVEIAS